MSFLFFHSFLRVQKLKLLALMSLGILFSLSLNATNSNAIDEAKAHFIEGSIDNSIAILESLDLQTNPQALVLLASIYCNTADWYKLENLVKDMQEIPFLSDLAYYFSGRIALANNRLGSARRAFEQAAKERPSNTQFIQGHLYFYQAICFKRLRQIDQAADAYEKALNNNFTPESLEEIIQLSQFHALLADAQTTIAFINSYPESLLKEDARVGAILGRAYLNKKLNYLAIKSFSKSLTLDPKQASTLALRANAYRLTQNYKAGLRDIKAAIALAPDLIELNYILGLINFEMGELDGANTAFQSTFSYLQKDTGFLLLSAQLAFTVKDIQFSKQALARYFQLEADTSHINAHYISLLLQEGEPIDSLTKPQSLDWVLFENYLHERNSADYILANTTSASLTFFMAQVARAKNNFLTEKLLLKATLERATKKSPEFLCANWQLKALEN
jgi:tetratricopeptide (TPR) repeat protein